MGTRTMRWLGALVVALVAMAFLAGATASAQEADGGGGDTPSCSPGETCVDEPPPPCDPETCPEPEPCTPETCVEPDPCDPDACEPCPDGSCDFDTDDDGWDDRSEEFFGSDPANAASVPEHTFIEGTCDDGVDNDADALTDAADPGCAPDADFDLVPDASDNCPTVWNSEQEDSDGDGLGDACEDNDGDGFFDGDEQAMGSDPNDAASTPETWGVENACEDTADNDLDGAIDDADEGCSLVLEASDTGADGTGVDDEVERDVLQEGDPDEVTPISAPAAGTGFSTQSGAATWALALAGALAMATTGLSLAGRRVARERARLR